MDNVVEHLSDPATTLRRWTVELSPHTHVFLFTAEALSRLVLMCGFDVETVGSFHLAPYPVREMIQQWRRGEYKEAVWNAMNEAGAGYARLIKCGPMLFTVARRGSSA